MPGPICVKCRCEMRCSKNAFVVRDPAVLNFPSTYWKGDKFTCPVCGHEIVVGFAKKGWSEEEAAKNGWDKTALEFVYNPPKESGT